jgi:RNA polymerase sigma-70 factor (ECF subfamily)
MTRARVAVAATAVAGPGLLAACSPGGNGTSAPEQQAPAANQAPTSVAGLVAADVGKLGKVVTAHGLTVYRFDKDTAKPSVSNCDGQCAVQWLPVIADSSTSNGQGVGGTWFAAIPEGKTRVAIGGWRPKRAKGEDLIRHLYEEHGRSLVAYATRLASDRAAAEDVIVPETLVPAWKYTDYLENGTGPSGARLLTVARNIVTNRIRARVSRPHEVEEPAESPAVQRDHAQTVVESMTVLRAMDGLSPEHREVLVEIHYRGRIGGSRRVPRGRSGYREITILLRITCL